MQFHSKRPAPPKAGYTIPIVSTRTIEVRDDKPVANQPKHGKLDYLTGPAKKPKKPVPTGKRLVEKRSLSIGRYIC